MKTARLIVRRLAAQDLPTLGNLTGDSSIIDGGAAILVSLEGDAAELAAWLDSVSAADADAQAAHRAELASKGLDNDGQPLAAPAAPALVEIDMRGNVVPPGMTRAESDARYVPKTAPTHGNAPATRPGNPP